MEKVYNHHDGVILGYVFTHLLIMAFKCGVKSFSRSRWKSLTWFLMSHGSPKNTLPQNGQSSYVIRRFIITIQILCLLFPSNRTCRSVSALSHGGCRPLCPRFRIHCSTGFYTFYSDFSSISFNASFKTAPFHARIR